ncbi:MAG: hypothetical protein ACR2OW_12210, partial [Methyloligellaceae bacterium]
MDEGKAMWKLVSLIFGLSILASCTSAVPNLNPKNAHKLLDGYRTRGAAHAILGSYGRKIGNVQFGYERVSVPPLKNVTLRKVAEIEVTENTKRQLEKAGVDLKKLASANLNLSGGTHSKANYKVIFIEILSLDELRKELRTLLKTSSDARADLTDNDARVIITSGFIFDHNTAQSIKGRLATGAHLRTISGAPEIDLVGSKKSKESLKVGDQTIVAYQFARLCWQKGKLRALVRDTASVDI